MNLFHIMGYMQYNYMKSKFEEYLYDWFMKFHPQVLDDDLQDKFDDWIGKLDPDELMILADKAIEYYLNKK